MKPWLCAAGVQLRDQIDTWFPDRSTASPEGWLGDSRHSRLSKSCLKKLNKCSERIGRPKGMTLEERVAMGFGVPMFDEHPLGLCIAVHTEGLLGG